jgi:hypothetical protein
MAARNRARNALPVSDRRDGKDLAFGSFEKFSRGMGGLPVNSARWRQRPILNCVERKAETFLTEGLQLPQLESGNRV